MRLASRRLRLLILSVPTLIGACASATSPVAPPRPAPCPVVAPSAIAAAHDGGSSSSFDPAPWQEDLRAHAALIMGAHTLGVGCGFTNGGVKTVLPRSGARVHISDCARLRADGSNAVAGVTPDVILPLLDRDSPYQRVNKIAAGLTAEWRKIVSRAPARANKP